MSGINGMMLVELGADATNEDLREQMRLMKRARDERLYQHIVCLIRGFDDDPRGLSEIPDARAFCRRLVDQGVISYLDVATTFRGSDEMLRGTLGAFEIWICAESPKPDDDTVPDRFRADLLRANALADSFFGPVAENPRD